MEDLNDEKLNPPKSANESKESSGDQPAAAAAPAPALPMSTAAAVTADGPIPAASASDSSASSSKSPSSPSSALSKNSTLRAELFEMGYDETIVGQALSVADNYTISRAVNWILVRQAREAAAKAKKSTRGKESLAPNSNANQAAANVNASSSKSGTPAAITNNNNNNSSITSTNNPASSASPPATTPSFQRAASTPARSRPVVPPRPSSSGAAASPSPVLPLQPISILLSPDTAGGERMTGQSTPEPISLSSAASVSVSQPALSTSSSIISANPSQQPELDRSLLSSTGSVPPSPTISSNVSSPPSQIQIELPLLASNLSPISAPPAPLKFSFPPSLSIQEWPYKDESSRIFHDENSHGWILVSASSLDGDHLNFQCRSIQYQIRQPDTQEVRWLIEPSGTRHLLKGRNGSVSFCDCHSSFILVDHIYCCSQFLFDVNESANRKSLDVTFGEGPPARESMDVSSLTAAAAADSNPASSISQKVDKSISTNGCHLRCCCLGMVLCFPWIETNRKINLRLSSQVRPVNASLSQYLQALKQWRAEAQRDKQQEEARKAQEEMKDYNEKSIKMRQDLAFRVSKLLVSQIRLSGHGQGSQLISRDEMERAIFSRLENEPVLGYLLPKDAGAVMADSKEVASQMLVRNNEFSKFLAQELLPFLDEPVEIFMKEIEHATKLFMSQVDVASRHQSMRVNQVTRS